MVVIVDDWGTILAMCLITDPARHQMMRDAYYYDAHCVLVPTGLDTAD